MRAISNYQREVRKRLGIKRTYDARYKQKNENWSPFFPDDVHSSEKDH